MLAGCAAEDAELRPATEGRSGSAYYSLESDGRSLGDARVWSPGTRKDALEVRFRIFNESLTPLGFDADVSFAEFRVDGRTVRARPRFSEDLTIPAGHAREFPLYFELPDDTTAKDLEEVEVQWSVLGPEGRLTYSTLFLREREERPALRAGSEVVPVWRGHNPLRP